jgi:hypothetical protein
MKKQAAPNFMIDFLAMVNGEADRISLNILHIVSAAPIGTTRAKTSVELSTGRFVEINEKYQDVKKKLAGAS